MNGAELTDLVATVAERLCGKNEHICVALIRQLAAGQPVSAARLAADIGMDAPAVGAVLQQMSDVAYDAAGNVVGFGLSLVPTAHQFRINGQTLYTWCALDTFLYTALLGQPSEVISHCPVTSQPITLAMTPDGITTLSPASSVISLVIPDGSVADCRRSAFCNYGHFFATPEAGTTWLDGHPNGIIVSIADAHQLGQLLAKHRLLLQTTTDDYSGVAMSHTQYIEYECTPMSFQPLQRHPVRWLEWEQDYPDIHSIVISDNEVSIKVLGLLYPKTQTTVRLYETPNAPIFRAMIYTIAGKHV
jgi:alkylmercury lyase